MGTKQLGPLLAELLAEFPDFKVMAKEDSRFMRLLNFLVLLVTFGKAKTFMTKFTTTIRHTVYTPDDWEDQADHLKVITLRHERVHMRQSDRYGFFTFMFLYLFIPVPFFRANYRARFEREAYEESMLALQEFGGNILSQSYREWMVNHFTTAEYGWMCTDKNAVETWYYAVSRTIVRSN